ncbi:UDP-2,4-diacetamido-2,4,6-trideoxy-beta-L-altropyranose hydrolase [Syntrophomonas erecta]
MKKIVIRTDSSIKIGTGHVMRCLTLADQLKEKEVQVEFICRDLEGNIIGIIESKGYRVSRLSVMTNKKNDQLTKEYDEWLGATWELDAEQSITALKEENVDLLIVDHYALDIKWENKLRSRSSKIMVIDDLANRKHNCDILLDQNYVENMESRYDRLVPASCKKLLGPKYVLLRPEFYKARATLKERDGIVRRIHIFFGGSDPTNETIKAIKAVEKLNRRDIEVDVVVGASNPHQKEIKHLCDKACFNYHYQVNNMAELMAKADLAIGAGGSTTWERCFLGLPSICVVVADNQVAIVRAMARNKAIINQGNNDNVDYIKLHNTLKNLIENKAKIKMMSINSLKIMSNNSPNWLIKVLFDNRGGYSEDTLSWSQ